MTTELSNDVTGASPVRISDWLCPVKFTKIVSFSFGQTSGYMLRKLMDANPKTFDDDFCVVFANTGREHEATLDFGAEHQGSDTAGLRHEKSWIKHKTQRRRKPTKLPASRRLI